MMNARALVVVWALFGQTAPAEQAVRPQGMVTDQTAEVLVRPAELKDSADFGVAKEAPEIQFCVIEGLPPLPKDKGLWSSWGQGIVASNGKYYAGVGNHLGIDGRMFLYEFDPETGEHRQVLDVFKFLGLKRGDWGHGKLHGRLDELDDGRLVFATYWGEHPSASMKAEDRKRIGGRLLSYSIRTGRAEDLGMPLGGDSWPMHATDANRKRFFAVGIYSNFLAYDLAGRRSIFAGKLPAGVQWDLRVTLVDDATGRCYGSNESAIYCYNPQSGEFSVKPDAMPRHPKSGEPTRAIRSYTRQRSKQGAFYAITYDGVVLKFWPDRVRVESLGLNWGKGYYSPSLAMSRGERYLYYSVDAHGSSFEHGSPIVQYDVKTCTKKVIAFLHPYYQRKYGYVFGGSYSVCIDPEGSKLVICWNGKFRGPEDKTGSFGDPSFMVISIPASERVE